MKVCVFGAGAIGGHLAARLSQGGASVSVVARGANLAALQERGLTVRTPTETITCQPRADEPAALGVQDAVLVTVKAPALPSVAAAIAPLLGPHTTVAFVMTGIPWWYFDGMTGPHAGRTLPRIDPSDAIRAAVGPARTLGGVIYSACTVVEPGVIDVTHAKSRLVLGELDGSDSPRAGAIAAAMRSAGMIVDVTPRIRDTLWEKLVMNLSTGPMSVLTQSAPQAYLGASACTDAMRAIVVEGVAVAQALGCTPSLDLARMVTQSQAMTHKPSILQDLELGRPMEVDGLLAAAQDLARMAGVTTPMLDLLTALVSARARAAGLY